MQLQITLLLNGYKKPQDNETVYYVKANEERTFLLKSSISKLEVGSGMFSSISHFSLQKFQPMRLYRYTDFALYPVPGLL